MTFSIENGLFNPSTSLAAERQETRPGIEIFKRDRNVKPRMKFQARMFFSCVGELFHAFDR